MKANGWTLLFHPLVCEQMQRLVNAAQKAAARGDVSNANIKLFDQVLKHIRRSFLPTRVLRSFSRATPLARPTDNGVERSLQAASDSCTVMTALRN